MSALQGLRFSVSTRVAISSGGLQLLNLVHDVLVDSFPATIQLVHTVVLGQVLRFGQRYCHVTADMSHIT